MPREVDQDELIERWTLVGGELERCRGKYGTNGLPFALLWRFFVQHARFPRGRSELPDEVVAFVARQLAAAATGRPVRTIIRAAHQAGQHRAGDTYAALKLQNQRLGLAAHGGLDER